MKSVFFLIALALSITSCAQTYYIVRHAEKATATDNQTMMANDPPLSPGGEERANALKDRLKDEQIKYIFSTNTIRTRTTALPLSKLVGLEIVTYKPLPDSSFFQKLRALDGNVVIVGHSNTVDDIVNGLVGEALLSDLQDNEYDNLFIVTKKNGKFHLEKKKFGKLVGQ